MAPRKGNSIVATETNNRMTITLTEEQQERLEAIHANTKDSKQTMHAILQTVLHQGLKTLEKRREKRETAAPSPEAVAKAQAILAKAEAANLAKADRAA
jgi:hypothetical protein